MSLPSDTPPHGDYAAYIERLTGGPDGKNKPEELFAPQAGTTPTDTKLAASANPPPEAKTLPEALASISFVGHIKWLVLAWFATQALDKFVPGTGFLSVPILLAYAGWALFKVNRHSSGALAMRARVLAQQALEEARKSSPFPKK